MNTFLRSLAALALTMASIGCDKGNDGPSIPDAGHLVDRCLGTEDMAVILASTVDAGVGVDSGAPNPVVEAYDCTITPECIALYFAEELDAAYQCVNDCLDPKPTGALSMDCRDCYTLEAVNCASEYCFEQCVGGVTSACSACFNASCDARLEECVGFPY